MEEEQFNAGKIRALAAEVEKGTYPNIHSLLISRHNRLIYENYWPGQDEQWGNAMGVVPHHRDSLHDIRSITKSIVSACVGIAISQGKIKSVDQRVFDFFPEYAKQDTGLKATLTIKHLLTMSTGLAWNEQVPYDNPENSEIRMINSPDPVGYVLSQPMEVPPGQQWKYNGGTTQLLAAIIEKATGQRIDRYARQYLLEPLGITRFTWFTFPGTDMPAAASGMRLRARDLLKFGLLYSNNGNWQGRQIVPAEWVQESFQSHIKIFETGFYGYQFWIFMDKVQNKTVRVVACVGNGDQQVFFDQEKGTVTVVNAGNYNKWNGQKNAADMMRDYVYPAMEQ
ncbi:serine hydrolase [Chitinophaga japonensis]